MNDESVLRISITSKYITDEQIKQFLEVMKGRGYFVVSGNKIKFKPMPDKKREGVNKINDK